MCQSDEKFTGLNLALYNIRLEIHMYNKEDTSFKNTCRKNVSHFKLESFSRERPEEAI